MNPKFIDSFWNSANLTNCSSSINCKETKDLVVGVYDDCSVVLYIIIFFVMPIETCQGC
jgi:hypothetical protein